MYTRKSLFINCLLSLYDCCPSLFNKCNRDLRSIVSKDVKTTETHPKCLLVRTSKTTFGFLYEYLVSGIKAETVVLSFGHNRSSAVFLRDFRDLLPLIRG